ncbi:MAG: tetratricopeptide repeat protein [Anaerolineae bacterium]|nr:tetratricopeptide repeat protein [Anaerolineae bacterium]
MRNLTLLACILILVTALAPAAAQGGDRSDPAHLIVSMQSDGEVRINRMDWDVNAFAPVFPGAAVRGSDYVDLSGRTAVLILCNDLTLLDQRGSEVPRCDPYAYSPVFYYPDDPDWEPALPPTVVTLPGSAAPPEFTGSANRNELTGGELDSVLANTETILGLDLDTTGHAFALAMYYYGQGMTFDAITILTALPDLECSDRRPTVDPPGNGVLTLVKSPVVYLRLGELYQSLGQDDVAGRYYRCGADLASALGDPADEALALARQANLQADPVTAIDLYQSAINRYAALGALDAANLLLEICGSRNCTLP